MTLIDLPQTRSASFGRGVSTFLEIARSWTDARRTRHALDTLTDRELDDIGLTRADIRRVAGR